jgi:transposase
LLLLLLPDPRFCLDQVQITPHAVTLCLRTTSSAAPCPLCAQPASQVHSHYTRSAHDLPIQGRPVVLRLSARRFFCRTENCPRRVFCEQFPDLLVKHAQGTTRLHVTHRDIGLALGGEPGSRLAAKLGMPTSPDTLLRRVKQARPSTTPAPIPRIIGVDDWAMRKGQTYGTIIIDLERSEVLELLPGRDGAELKTWLGRHPEVEVLSRDRWAPFADAATECAPQARQVADRWHLLKNSREALERFLDRYAGRIAEAFAPPPPAAQQPDPAVKQEVAPDATSVPTTEATLESVAGMPPPEPHKQQPTARQQQRSDRYQEVRRRHTEGQSLRQIAQEMRLSKNTVMRQVRSDHCPDWRPGRTGPSQAGPYRERIDAWLGAGNRNVAELHRQLQAEDSNLGYDVLRRFVARLLAARGERRLRVNAAQPPPTPPPSAKGLSFAVIIRAEKRTEKQRTQVARLREVGAEVAEAVGMVEAFAALVRKQCGTTLTAWQEKARTGSSLELRRFAEGLRRDQAAVQAALDEPWSNGPVEGHVNRLKTIKRQMYGRAGLPLLRARVLNAD